MGIGQSCQLRQVGHAKHLLMLGYSTKFFRHFLGRPTGNAGIHLVEDQGVHLILLCQNIFHSQHDSGQLTAGGHFAHGLQSFAGIGRHIECHRIGTVGGQFQFAELAGELHPGHIQLGKFRQDPLRHIFRCSLAACPQGKGCSPGFLFRFCQLLFQPGQMVVGKFDIIQFLFGFLQILQNIRTGNAVLAAKFMDHIQTGFDLLQFIGGIA